MDITLVYGTAAPAGRLALAMRSFAEALGDIGGVACHSIDLAATSLPFAGMTPAADQAEALEQVLATVAQTDALALFMPVYRAAPPGALKNLLDLLPLSSLENKPVAQITMGASPHHYLANQLSLAPVLNWFGAVALPGVYLTGRSFEEGALTAPAQQELRQLAESLVETTRRLSGLKILPRPLAANSGG